MPGKEKSLVSGTSPSLVLATPVPIGFTGAAILKASLPP